MEAERAARQTRRDYCRGCAERTLHPWFGWATDDGRENTIRPRAYYRTCAQCGLRVMVLADVTDAEGIARYVLDEHLRPLGGSAKATDAPTGPPPTDWDGALQFLLETAWQLYSEKWNPAVGVNFHGYALTIMRQRLPRWCDLDRGEPNSGKGRVYPKAHAPSVSTSYDAIVEGADFDGGDRAVGRSTHDLGGLEPTYAGRAGDFADDRSPDLARALTPRRRD